MKHMFAYPLEYASLPKVGWNIQTHFLSTALLFMVFLSPLRTQGQQRPVEWQLGYWAPFATNVGAEVGATWDASSWFSASDSASQRTWTVLATPRIGYFWQPNVQHSFVVSPELTLQRRRPEKRWYPMFSVGLGYLLSLQRQEGTVHLGSGAIDYRSEAQHALLPSVSLGMGVRARAQWGYYIKTTYGRSLVFGQEDAAFFGASVGITRAKPSSTQSK